MSGIGLRAPHIDLLLASRPPVPFVEVHAENHMGEGRAFRTLERVARDYPVSLHGVGLSLGGHERPDPGHLANFAELVRRMEPVLVSEHLAWCRNGDICLNDLMPVCYDSASLEAVVRNVDIVQQAINRRLLIENPSRYLAFSGDDMDESAFLAALTARTGCGILLDVNNVVVSARNTGLDATAYIDALPADSVGEIHLAGHEEEDGLLIDTHGAPVCEAVWALYEQALRRFGSTPTLIERDRNIPDLAELLAEAHRAGEIGAAAAQDLSDAA